ncbi:Uma2 family endonuclease [Candidatus Albibeggiatoa sp. nov. BB20]|uniref:Uma2 family endonuclease n=1 Tax=Candidatus Albibeggiatoa sp. nov. BB20 TaxID=3162723 RepID=UPI00336557A7
MSVAAEYFSQPPDYPTLHTLTVKQYYRMAEVGILQPNARIELIEGKIIDMPPIGYAHADWVDRLARLFIKTVPDDIGVRIQNPVRLNGNSEPQPDIALLCPRQQPYNQAHPNPEDVLLIIEVADSTLHYDRNIKAKLYAQHHIPEFWLLDVAANQLEIFQAPQDGKYNLHTKPNCDAQIELVALENINIDLKQLFNI